MSIEPAHLELPTDAPEAAADLPVDVLEKVLDSFLKLLFNL